MLKNNFALLANLGKIVLVGASLLVMSSGQGAIAQQIHRHPAPPDSFLKYKVYSVDQLIQEVQNDPQIQRRFADHFNVPVDRVVSYMRANLVESYIPETGLYTCYCIRPDGTIYPVKQEFRKGTKVFSLRNGQPVMKWVCGNPLSKFLPAVETRTIEKPIIKISPSIETITPADTQDIMVPSEVETPIYKPVAPALIGPGAAAASSAVFYGSGGTSLWPLLLVPLGFVHSGSSSNNTPVPPTTTGGTTGGTTGATTGGTTGSETTGGTTGSETTGGTTGSATTGGATGSETTGGTTGLGTTGGTTGVGTSGTTGGTTVPEPGSSTYVVAFTLAALWAVRRKLLRHRLNPTRIGR